MRWRGARRLREAGGCIDRGLGGMRPGCVAGAGWPRGAGPALGGSERQCKRTPAASQRRGAPHRGRAQCDLCLTDALASAKERCSGLSHGRVVWYFRTGEVTLSVTSGSDAMRSLIVVGDMTSGGGSVVSGSMETDIDGRPVARVGDMATCQLHKGAFPIVSGDPTLIVEGQPVARHGDRLACGCQVLAHQQSHVLIDAGLAVASAALSAVPQASSAASIAEPATTAVCEECLLAAARKGAAFLGR